LGLGRGSGGGLLGRAGGAAEGEAGALAGAEGGALAGAGEGAALAGVEGIGLNFSALAGPIGIAAAMAAPIAMPYIIKGMSSLWHFLSAPPQDFKTQNSILHDTISTLKSQNTTLIQSTTSHGGGHGNLPRGKAHGVSGINLNSTTPLSAKAYAEAINQTTKNNKKLAIDRFASAVLTAKPWLQIPQEQHALAIAQHWEKLGTMNDVERRWVNQNIPGGMASFAHQIPQIQATIKRQQIAQGI